MEHIDNSDLGRSWSVARLRALHDEVEIDVRNPKTGAMETRSIDFDKIIKRAEWAVDKYLKTGPREVIGSFFTDIVWTFRCDTAMTDGIRLFFNPIFANELISMGGYAAKEEAEKSGKKFYPVDFPTFKLFLFVVTHEVYHQIYRHIEQAQHKTETANGKNHALANISMDIEINRDIEIQWPEFAGATVAADGRWEADKYKQEIWSLIFDDKYKAGEQPDETSPILPPPVQEQQSGQGGQGGPQEPGKTYTAPDDYKAGWEQALADIKAGKVNASGFKPLPVDPSKFDHKVLQHYVVGESLKYGKNKSLNEAASGVNQDEWNQGYNDCIQTWINNMNGGASGSSSGGDKFENLEQPPTPGGQGDNQNQNAQNGSHGSDSQSSGQNGNQQDGSQQGGQQSSGSQGSSQNSNSQNGSSSNGGSQGDFQGSSDEQIGGMSGAEAAQDAINSAKAAQAAAKQAAQNAANSGSASDKAAAQAAMDAAKQSTEAAKDARQAAMEGNKGKARRKAKEARDAAQKASQAAAQTGGQQGGDSQNGNQQGPDGQGQEGNGQSQDGNENGSSQSGSGGTGRGAMDNKGLDSNKSDAKVKVEVGKSWGDNDIISKEDGMKIAEEEGQPYTGNELSKSPTEVAKGRLSRRENDVRDIGKGTSAPMDRILDNIAAALKPPVSNWKAILSKHLRAAGDHRTKYKMDRRRIPVDRADWAEEDTPKKSVNNNAADVFYLVDASGSISNRDLYRTFSEIVSKGGIENRKDMKIRKSAFTYFADRVVDTLIRTWTIDDSTAKKMKLIQRTDADSACGGGTDIQGSVEHVVKLKKYFSTVNPKTVLIVFTDGEDWGFEKISALSANIRKEIIFCILNSKNRIPDRAKAFAEAGIPAKNIVGIDTESL